MCQNVATRLENTLHTFKEDIAHKVYFLISSHSFSNFNDNPNFLLSNFALAAKVTWRDDYWGSV